MKTCKYLEKYGFEFIMSYNLGSYFSKNLDCGNIVIKNDEIELYDNGNMDYIIAYVQLYDMYDITDYIDDFFEKTHFKRDIYDSYLNKKIHYIGKKNGLDLENISKTEADYQIAIKIEGINKINDSLEILYDINYKIIKSTNFYINNIIKKFMPNMSETMTCRLCNKNIYLYEYKKHLECHVNRRIDNFCMVVKSLPIGVIPEINEFIRQYPLIYKYKRDLFYLIIINRTLRSFTNEINIINSYMRDYKNSEIKIDNIDKIMGVAGYIISTVPSWLIDSFIDHTNIKYKMTPIAYKAFKQDVIKSYSIN